MVMTMKKNKLKLFFQLKVFFLSTFAILFFSSCQQVVSIDLNKADPHIVIEGTILDRPGPFTVSITKTGTYFDQSLSFPPVSSAVVTLQDNFSNTDTLKEKTPGTYYSSTILGAVGMQYSLHVLAEGKEYTASSTMPKKVIIDSLYAMPRVGRGGESGFDIYIAFKDPPEPGNYYRLNARSSTAIPADSIDGRRYRLYTDKLTNGNEMYERIRSGRNVQPGDTITVELLSIDKAAYDYFSTLRDILSSDRSPTSLSPANPNTNLSNGSLGFFAAFTIDKKSIVMK